MEIIGHRGCPVYGPENTIAAFKTASEYVDMIELDVQRCQTGELVVFHDTALSRLTQLDGAVPAVPWHKLSSVTIGDSTATIPRLSDVLSILPSEVGINIEVKHSGMAEEIESLVETTSNRIIVSSFIPHALTEFTTDTIECGYLFDSEWESQIEIAQSLGCDAVHPAYELVTPERIEKAHASGLQVNAWTVPDTKTARVLQQYGVDGAIVDDWTVVETPHPMHVETQTIA